MLIVTMMIKGRIVKESYLFVTGQWRQSPPYQWGCTETAMSPRRAVIPVVLTEVHTDKDHNITYIAL